MDEIDDSSLKALTYQGLLDLADGAAIFSAGGGGDLEVGYLTILKSVIPTLETPNFRRNSSNSSFIRIKYFTTLLPNKKLSLF
jgi:hypothetical protein